MNKLFVILALLAFMPANVRAESYVDDNDAFVLAKAVKLGRGKAYSITDNSNLNAGGGTINPDKPCDPHCADCDKSTGTCNSCANGYYLENDACVSCPANATCDNGYTFICKDYYYKFGDSCQAICSGVSCKSGYKTVSKTDECCCEKQTCSAGYYVSGSSCVACSSGTWSSGGTATSCSSCSTIYAGGSNITCTSCTTTGTCTGSNTALDCSVCTSGYTKNLTSCPSGQTLQQGPICVDSGFTCGKCVSSSSSNSSSGSSSSCPRSPTGSKSAGSSCSTGSECSSGWCIPGTTVNPSYTGSGSLCGACH